MHVGAVRLGHLSQGNDPTAAIARFYIFGCGLMDYWQQLIDFYFFNKFSAQVQAWE